MVSAFLPSSAGAGVLERPDASQDRADRDDAAGNPSLTTGEFDRFLSSLMRSLDEELAAHRTPHAPGAQDVFDNSGKVSR